MEIQKEKIAHEKHLLSQGVDFKYLPNIQYNELENVYELIEWDEEYSEALNEINSSWCTWQAAKAQAVPEWISVDDELPSEGDCLLGISTTKLAKFNVYQVVALDEFDDCEITHWMHLPQAPKAQEQSHE
ncbi:DUF551 domain-containing protein [uncultured Acinetobacter sp.]|uniref:DUF551 domain-containing protein n=1 Tax=uncultured Acinetobacter sp. TaxID=165433 RepID=UPI0025EED0CC|nr:DUF551 domain-containing protein [uncultured Acinetobacter sp.]